MTKINKNIKLIVLFGSRARGKTHPASDADIAVLGLKSLTLAEQEIVAEQMAAELNISEDKIDIVDLQEASPLLQYQAAQEGKLLHGDKNKWRRFQVLAWKRYLDTAKLRRAGKKALLRAFP